MADTQLRAELRNHARSYAKEATGMLAQAFNLCSLDHHPHVYSGSTQLRAMDLLKEIVELVESGAIHPNPAHRRYLQLQEAKGNCTLQAVLKRASQKTPIRARKGQRE